MVAIETGYEGHFGEISSNSNLPTIIACMDAQLYREL